MKFPRITVDPKQMGGVPCIRGLRIPVATVVGMAADGVAAQDILSAYPDLERDDIQEALHYAADGADRRRAPSVVLFRGATNRTPERQLALLLADLPALEAALNAARSW